MSEYPRPPRSVGGILIFISKGSCVTDSLCQFEVSSYTSILTEVVKLPNSSIRISI